MEWDLIHSYTRWEAIEDGTLIDVTEMAKEIGFKHPVALTRAVYAKIEDKPDIEDIDGRIWDVVCMFKYAITRMIPSKEVGENLIFFKLRLNDSNVNYKKFKSKEVVLKALIHGGDFGEPVITIMLPEED